MPAATPSAGTSAADSGLLAAARLLDFALMSPAVRKLLRLLGLLAYAAVAVLLFVIAGYASFGLFVRSGAAPVPDVEGMPVEEARGVLADSGFELSVEEGGRFDTAVPAGGVLAQRPEPRTLAKRGATVGAILSLGPQQLTVPDLVGRSFPSAQVALAAAGLDGGRVLQVYSSGPAGTVVEQDPRPGGVVPADGTVDLMLAQSSTAQRYLMPDLVYRDYDEVRAFFERAGLRLGRVTFEIYEGAGEGTILRQFPLAGHPITPQEAVSLVVAAGGDVRQEVGRRPAPGGRPRRAP
jgi:eukaryotic-like serine/threonine-protein kinase